jgi:hydrogenase maturation protein HypF
MRHFAMCAECTAEYGEPAERRFHAEPIACPKCGPAMELVHTSGKLLAGEFAAITKAAAAVRNGEIVALKGIGGFQLLVDATNAAAVEKLRRRKRRPDKPFAVMMPDVASARICCELSEADEPGLTGVAAPIVLVRKRSENAIADNVAPRNPYLGVMLPYSPLHWLLLTETARPLVCTSGNVSDEPICIDTDDARERLAHIADVFLNHDRQIARPLDDSVVRTAEGRLEIIRRARGFTPKAIDISIDGPVTLAFGAIRRT